MYPRPFEYVAPETLPAALEALARPGARPLAGGASLVPMLKLRLLAPELLVDLRLVPGLAEVAPIGEGTIRIGAMATHAAVAGDPGVRAGAAALAEAAAVVGDVAVRGQGTVCGALAHADAVADEPGPALALAARMLVHSRTGERVVDAGDFFVDAFTTSLEPDELLVAVELPAARAGEASAYGKVGRRGPDADYPVAGMAAWVRVEGGTVTAARLAVTGASTRAALLPAAADALVGTDGSDGAVDAALRGAGAEVPTIGDVHGSAEYKQHLVGVVAGRVVRRALARAGA